MSEQPTVVTEQQFNVESFIASLDFSKPKRIETKRGPRMLSKCKATAEFWEVWNEHKEELVKAGLSVSEYNGKWDVCRWKNVDDEILKAEADRREASRQVSADVDIPCNDGLEYLPFQKAGIIFAVSVFEEDNNAS